MIRLVTPSLEGRLFTAAPFLGPFGIKICSLYETYRQQPGVLDVWLLLDGQTVCGAVSRLESGGTIALIPGSQPDFDELAAFLPAAGLHWLDGMQETLSPLASRIPSRMQLAAHMQYDPALPPPDRPFAGQIFPADRLSEVYPLLCAGQPGFARQVRYDSWLTETSHKLRHGQAEIWVLKVDSVSVSTVGIYFKAAGQALLAGLATLPAYRGRGYGQAMMAYATGQALWEGLHPHLLTADAQILPFHAQCGYRPQGDWGRLFLSESKEQEGFSDDGTIF